MNLKNPLGTLRRVWNVLGRLPLGGTVLSHIFSFFVPYTGTIVPKIEELRPGSVRVRMGDRRRVRNHLSCVHAMAMANLAEAATGLAVGIALADHQRAILTGFRIRYLKKARGSLVGVCRFVLPPDFVEGELEVEGSVEDSSGQVVASAEALWRVGLNR